MFCNPINVSDSTSVSCKRRILSEPLLKQSLKTTNGMLKNSLAALSVLGASMLTTSCVADEPDTYLTNYVSQCPKVDTPIKSISGFSTKTDYLMNLLDILPNGASITDVKEINVSKENGDKIILTPIEVSNDRAKFEYVLNQADGNVSISTLEIFDSSNGQIRTSLSRSGAIESEYTIYTQSTADFSCVHESKMKNNSTQKAIIQKTKTGFNKLHKNGTKEQLQISAKI